MKKFYTLLILLSIGITQIYAQPCINCTGAPTIGDKASTIGTGTNAGGDNSFAGGYYSLAPANNSFVFGNQSKVNGLNGIALGNNVTVNNFADCIAIGNYAISSAANSYTFGRYIEATGSNSLTLGLGTSSLSPLTNNKPNSIMFGVTEFPSLTIVKPTNGDIGYLGIGTENPTEMAHVVGTLLIERTGTTESSLQFRHPNTKGTGPGNPEPLTAPYHWDIYSDYYGLKFNTVDYHNVASQAIMISKKGSVGIGADITSPKARLHVDNNIIADGNITTLNNFVLASDYSSDLDHWEISRTSNGLNYAFKNKKITRDVLFMGNDGSIGVGTPEPSTTLEVNGSFKAQSANIEGDFSINILNAQSANISEDIYIKGKIGIGTTNPMAKFHLHDSKKLTPNKLDEDVTESRNLRKLFHITTLETGSMASDGFSISYEDATLYFRQNEQGPFNISGVSGGLTIATDGNIGIGNSVPQARLDVNGSFIAENATLSGTLNANSATIASAFSANILNGQSANITGNAIINGHLGIKTSDPQALLHLHDPKILIQQKGMEDSTGTNRGIAKILQITNANSSGEGFTIHRDPTYSLSALIFKQNDRVPLMIEGPGGGITIASDGNIGISNSVPQARLDVNGSFIAENAKINGALTANSAEIKGKITANSAEIKGDLTAKSAEIKGDLTAYSATINGAANVTGALTANSAKITGLIEAPSAEIKGKIKAQEIEVTIDGKDWPDFVFENNYTLMNLQEVEQFINENKHLPAVPSAAEVEANGVNLGEMNAILIQKVEELTLYILDLQKQINELKTK